MYIDPLLTFQFHKNSISSKVSKTFPRSWIRIRTGILNTTANLEAADLLKTVPDLKH